MLFCLLHTGVDDLVKEVRHLLSIASAFRARGVRVRLPWEIDARR